MSFKQLRPYGVCVVAAWILTGVAVAQRWSRTVSGTISHSLIARRVIEPSPYQLNDKTCMIAYRFMYEKRPDYY